MSLSESFDDLAAPKQYELNIESKFLSDGVRDRDPSDTSETIAFSHWQDHLLPISCIEQEDNLTVLRVELETAHQLLQHQQNVIDSLTEKLTNCELYLQRTQDELAVVQQTCECHTTNMIAVEAVCRDLKTQLRRQQQRVLQYRNLLKDQGSTTAPTEFANTAKIVVGCDSISTEARSVAQALKPSPVSAWSAPETIGLTGPLARYRKLATIRMAAPRLKVDATSERLSSVNPGVTKMPAAMPPPVESSLAAAGVRRVELPSFTRSH